MFTLGQIFILSSKWVSGGPSRQADSPAPPLATRRLPPARPPTRCFSPARPPACLTRELKDFKGTQKETQGHSNEHRNTYVLRHCPGTYLEWGIKNTYVPRHCPGTYLEWVPKPGLGFQIKYVGCNSGLSLMPFSVLGRQVDVRDPRGWPQGQLKGPQATPKQARGPQPSQKMVFCLVSLLS